MARHLDFLMPVAIKALDVGKAPEAERLLASIVADFQALAERASCSEEWELVVRMHDVLAPILPRLEAATGKPWTRCLDVVKRRSRDARLPPRGRA
jgi:hypothetical protein